MMKRWTTCELGYLYNHANEGAKAIAEHLNRSEKSVVCCASKYGISLRVRYFCPRCSRYVLMPLNPQSGWCNVCSIEELRDKAALRNREARMELDAEKERLLKVTRERQALYSDTNRMKSKLKKLRKTEKNKRSAP